MTRTVRIITVQQRIVRILSCTPKVFWHSRSILTPVKCSFCGDEPESIVHLFWSYQKTSFFWNSVTNWLFLCGIVDQNFRLNCAVALGLGPPFAGVIRLISFCLLIARCFIWKWKYNQKLPDLPGLICLLKTYKELDLSKNALNKNFWEPLNKWLWPLITHLSNLSVSPPQTPPPSQD